MSQGRFLFVPDTVPPKMFMFIGFFLARSRQMLIDERQITHLMCARLKYDLYDFFRGCLGSFIQEKEEEAGPKHP